MENTVTVNSREMVGVILAAGKGRRMYPCSENLPKPMLPICGKPVLVYQLEMMKQLGIKQVFIVIKHCGFEIVKSIGDGRQYGLSVCFVEQHETLGIAHAVGQLEARINSPFLLFLGDIFFVSDRLHDMIPKAEENIGGVLAAKTETDTEAIKRNYAIFTEQDGRTVRRVIEKPRYIQNNLKGCGLYWFDLNIFDAIRRTPRTAMRDEYEITEAIQVLIDDGVPVKVCNIIHEDLNLTCPYDLLHINMYELKRRKLDRFIGQNCHIRNQDRIVRSVIGDNVTIGTDIDIINSVVFSDVQMGKDSPSVLENVIVTPSGIIPIPLQSRKEHQ